MNVRYSLWMAIILVWSSSALAATEFKELERLKESLEKLERLKIERGKVRVTYPDNWGPNLLDPKLGGEVIAVSSDNAEHDGQDLNDGFAGEGNHWEPVWTKGASYVIIRLRRAAPIARIQFTNHSDGNGYPKSVKITPLSKDRKPLDKPRHVKLKNSPVQIARLDPALTPARLLRFDFGLGTYNREPDPGETRLEIGEIAVFKSSYSLGFGGLRPGSITEDRIQFVDGDVVYGKIKFPDNKIVIYHANQRILLQRTAVYGIRMGPESEGVRTTRVILRTGEIVTGKIESKGLAITFGDIERPLSFPSVAVAGLAGPAQQGAAFTERQERGTIELFSGDKALVDPASIALAIEPTTSWLLGKKVMLQDVKRIQPVKEREGVHRFVFWTKEIVFARLASRGPKQPDDLLLELLAGIKLKVSNNSVKSYLGPSGRDVKLNTPVDILALRSGDLLVGTLARDQEIKLSTLNFGEISLNSDLILFIRSNRQEAGRVEVWLRNKSVIRGTLVAGPLKFTRYNQKSTIDIKPEHVGILDRLSVARMDTIRKSLLKDKTPDDLTEVSLYLFFNEHISDVLDTLLVQSNKRGLWTFEVPAN